MPADPTAVPPRRRRPEWTTVITWIALALAVGLVLSETVALREAGRRLRAQEAAERAARGRE